jgi:hypothetical protein
MEAQGFLDDYTATYAGDSSYNSSTSSTVPVTIAKAATTLTPENNSPLVYSSGFSSNVPVAVTLTAPYSLGAAPTGSIALTVNGKSAGGISSLTATHSSSTFDLRGFGSIAGTLLNSGANTLTETYSGDTNYAGSTATTTINDTDGVGSFAMSNSGDIALVAGTPSQEGITVTPAGGFYGNVYLSWSNLPAGIQFALPPVMLPILDAESNGFNMAIQTAFTVAPGTYPITLTGEDVTGKIKASTTFNIVVKPDPANANITLSNSGPASIVAENSLSRAANITITPVNGFVGPLNFTCKITTSMSSPVNAPGCVGFPTEFVGSSPQTFAVAFPSSTTTTPGTYSVDISAVDPLNTAVAASTSFTLTVKAAPSIALSNSGNITVSAGATTGNTSTITVTPSNGLTGKVNLSCSVTAVGAGIFNDTPTCSLPASLTISGTTAATATLTVLTTAPTTSELHFPLTRIFLGGGGATLAMVFFFGIPARRRTWRTLLSILAIIVVAGAIGCGGGSSSTATTGGTGGSGGTGGGGGTTIPGTTPGAYTVTVTGSDAATGQVTATTTVNLTVN